MASGERLISVRVHDGTEKKIALDEDGFIKNSNEWVEEYAEAVAKEESIQKLTEEHWKVIKYLRDYYLKFDSCPPIRMLCSETGFDLKKIYELFPTGPAKGACRLAGAPKPTGCV